MLRSRVCCKVKCKIESTDAAAPESFKLEGYNTLWRGTEQENALAEIDSKFKSTTRFRPDQVRLIEDQLEAEYMPFCFLLLFQ